MNLRAPFLLSGLVFPHMRRAGRGSIINVSSVAGKKGWASASAYCASKFGLTGLTEALADEGRPYGIRAWVLYVGVVPGSLGLIWYPFLRRLGASGMSFVLALTVSGVPLVLSVVLLILLGLPATERLFRRGREGASRLSTSYRVAAGIGLRNLGEGLAIGAAFAPGEAALGVFLVVGSTPHNITEGVGIAAPILEEKPSLRNFAGLALLGGGPAIVGTWIAGFAYSPFASAPWGPGLSCR